MNPARWDERYKVTLRLTESEARAIREAREARDLCPDCGAGNEHGPDAECPRCMGWEERMRARRAAREAE